MSNLYDRADIYDVCSTPRDWRIIREHWEKVLEDDLPRTLLDVSVGSGNLTLPLGEVGVRLSGCQWSQPPTAARRVSRAASASVSRFCFGCRVD